MWYWEDYVVNKDCNDKWIYIAEDRGAIDSQAHKNGHWYWNLDWFELISDDDNRDFAVDNDDFLSLFL